MKLYEVETIEEIFKLINERKQELLNMSDVDDDLTIEELPGVENIPIYHIGRGLFGDFKRRFPWYLSDFMDGCKGIYIYYR